jgi:selenocysteine lyase/cysteine desulfurase
MLPSESSSSVLGRTPPALEGCAYLNIAGYGVMAPSVLGAYLERLTRWEQQGSRVMPDVLSEVEAARAALATWINAEPTELAFAGNSAEPLAMLLATIREGDEVIACGDDALEILASVAYACRRHRATPKWVASDPDPERFAESLRRAKTSRSRIALLGTVGAEHGVRLPVEVARDALGPDVRVVVDAAQSVSVLPLDVRSLRADAVVGSTHKWLCGPKATAFFWVSPQFGFEPALLGLDAFPQPWPVRSAVLESGPPAPRPEPRAAELGHQPWAAFASIPDALAHHEALGWEAIGQHIIRTAGSALEALAQAGWDVITPAGPEARAGIVTVTRPGLDARNAVSSLRRDDVICRPALGRDGDISALRFSFGWFCSGSEIEQLQWALTRIG